MAGYSTAIFIKTAAIEKFQTADINANIIALLLLIIPGVIMAFKINVTSRNLNNLTDNI